MPSGCKQVPINCRHGLPVRTVAACVATRVGSGAAMMGTVTSKRSDMRGRSDQRGSERLIMPVPMVQVRIMRMRMEHGLVPVQVRMRFGAVPLGTMRVLVVLVMRMQVLVFQRLVF